MNVDGYHGYPHYEAERPVKELHVMAESSGTEYVST